MEIVRHANSSLKATAALRSQFVDPDTIPWTRWVMAGTEFKLLNINPTTGGFSLLLKVEPHNEAPLHGHLGAVEGWILAGSFGYADDIGKAGDYIYEGGGIRHEPHTGPDGVLLFAVAFGPVSGFDAAGNVSGVLDARMIYDIACANDAAGHIDWPPHWV